tara:strand:+ start:26481 stop:26765 length:285 start_codon:yes stop_codon:yes gene_type:complete
LPYERIVCWFNSSGVQARRQWIEFSRAGHALNFIRIYDGLLVDLSRKMKKHQGIWADVQSFRESYKRVWVGYIESIYAYLSSGAGPESKTKELK